MSDIDKKSIKRNMLLNAIKGLMSVIFPLISFPYVSRVLGVDNVGKYNFANSIVNYFILIAGLGISTYAIREGARIRENRESFNGFANQMFSINIISTLVSYILLGALLLIGERLQIYSGLIIMLSLQILFKTIGIEWLYSIYEEYAYITVRSIILQIISLILLFLFVKEQDDVLIYALITGISSVGSNVLNFLHARKYCKFRFILKIDWKKHFKPIMILFATTVTVTIYVNSDITILGLLCGDRVVGIYSVSIKVYSIVKTILSSVLVVSIPRLSAMLGEKKVVEFNKTAADIYKTLITVALPAIVGVIVLRREIVLLISDYTYMDATSSLALLSVALFFCLGAWFWGQCILVPMKKEKKLFEITVISALVNIGLNVVMIPFFKENAAAITTIIAEGLSFVWCSWEGRKSTQIRGISKVFFKVLIGCIVIVLWAFFSHELIKNIFGVVIMTVLGSVIIYLLIEILLRNETVAGVLKEIIGKAKKE